MLTIARYDSETRSVVNTAGTALDARPLWVDVEAPTPEEMKELGERFGLHRLAVEDSLHLDQRPKLEEYPNHLFLVVHGFRAKAGEVGDLELEEMHIFLGPDWVLTVHELPSPSVRDARKRVEADAAGTIGRGVDYLAYLVADAVVDQNFPLLDQFDLVLENLEDEIFHHAEKAQLERLFELKRSLVSLRRVLSPQRDVIGLLSRRGTPHIQDRTVLYFRDVYDHLIRLHEQLDAARDLVSTNIEGYLSMVANRTNDITKQLTLISTIFLPLSFITGFFGQNFDVLSSRPFFVLMIASVIGIPVGLLLWIRQKHWL